MSDNFLIRLTDADVVLSGEKVLHGLNWQLLPCEHWRVNGPNGAGKSTFLRTIAGLIWPVAKSPPSRIYHFAEQKSHLLAGVKQKIGFAAYAMQDDYVRGMRNLTCHEVIASGFKQDIMVYQTISESQHNDIDVMVSRLRLKSATLQSSFTNASHGQKSAVLFARALIHQPKLLVLDEIFNGVDQTHFSLMIELLHEYKNRGGQIILSWHEHDVKDIDEMFTHCLKLDKGRIHSKRPFCSVVETSRPSAKLSPRYGDLSKTPGKILIHLENVNIFLANKPILKNINWIIHRHDRWLLKGENGAGKTTLLKTLLAQIRPAIGSKIWRRGFNSHSSVWQIRKLIGYVSPELQQSYHYNVSVTHAVASGFFSSIGLYEELNLKQKQILEHTIVEFELTEIADRGVHQISSGQMRRVLIARAMVLQPELVIFDEIFANLDTESRVSVIKHLHRLANKGKTMIFVDHQNECIFKLCNKVIELKDAEVKHSGDLHY